MLSQRRHTIDNRAFQLILGATAGILVGGLFSVAQHWDLRHQVVGLSVAVALLTYAVVSLSSHANSVVFVLAALPLVGIVGFVPAYQQESLIVTPTSCLIALAFLLWVARTAVTRNPLRRPYMALPAILLIISGLISILGAENPNAAAKGVLNENLTPVVFYLVILNSIEGLKHIYLALTAFLVTSAIAIAASFLRVASAGYAFIYSYGPTLVLDTMQYWIRRYVGGLFLNANVFGGFLLIVIPVCLCMALRAPSKNRHLRILWTMILLAALAAVLLTFSRSVWLVSVLSVLMVLLVRRRLMLALATLLILTAIVVPFSESAVLWRFRATGGTSDLARLELLKEAWNSFVAFPLTGVGARNFEHTVGDKTFSSAHNVVADFAAERGLLGLLAVLVFLYKSVALTISTYRIQRPSSYAWLIPGLGAGVLGVVLYSLTSGAGFFMHKNNETTLLLFWGLLAILEFLRRPSDALLPAAETRPHL